MQRIRLRPVRKGDLTVRTSYLVTFLLAAFCALIFAHRAFAVREILARTAADIVLLPFVPFRLLLLIDVAWLFSAAIAPCTAFSCRCSFDSSCFNASTMSMEPPLNIKHWHQSNYKDSARIVRGTYFISLR